MGMPIPGSLVELAELQAADLSAVFRGAFAVEGHPTARLLMTERGWADALALGRPRAEVEQQLVIYCRDRALGFEAVVNPLRSNRTRLAVRPVAQLPSRSELQCRWCDLDGWHAGQADLWADDFGTVHSQDGRICARPNWARQSVVSGLVFGDERMHDPLRLTKTEFVAMFEIADVYIAKARVDRPGLVYFMVFMNVGARSASSVPHAHLQVVGRSDRHFAYPEAIAARGTREYWTTVEAAHSDVGLSVRNKNGVAWATLVPLKERDVTATSSTLAGGAALMHDVLHRLIRHGSNSFSLAAILAPWQVTGRDPDGRFERWPAVLWRLVDRGDANESYADIGCLELFGSAIVGTDPFAVARWLNEEQEA